MIQMENKYLFIVKDILSKYPYTFYAFGSRAKEKARKLSDLDICYKDNIPDSIILDIDFNFKESDLPFIVDIVNWKNMSLDFRKIISEDLIKI